MERICSVWSKFFSLKVDPILKMGYVVKGFKQEDTKVVSLCKNGGFSWRCNIQLTDFRKR